MEEAFLSFISAVCSDVPPPPPSYLFLLLLSLPFPSSLSLGNKGRTEGRREKGRRIQPEYYFQHTKIPEYVGERYGVDTTFYNREEKERTELYLFKS